MAKSGPCPTLLFVGLALLVLFCCIQSSEGYRRKIYTASRCPNNSTLGQTFITDEDTEDRRGGSKVEQDTSPRTKNRPNKCMRCTCNRGKYTCDCCPDDYTQSRKRRFICSRSYGVSGGLRLSGGLGVSGGRGVSGSRGASGGLGVSAGLGVSGGRGVSGGLGVSAGLGLGHSRVVRVAGGHFSRFSSSWRATPFRFSSWRTTATTRYTPYTYSTWRTTTTTTTTTTTPAPAVTTRKPKRKDCYYVEVKKFPDCCRAKMKKVCKGDKDYKPVPTTTKTCCTGSNKKSCRCRS